MAKIKRRKPAALRKEANLRARVAHAHLAEFVAAANDAGITLSAWVNDRLLKCARAERAARERAKHASSES